MGSYKLDIKKWFDPIIDTKIALGYIELLLKDNNLNFWIVMYEYIGREIYKHRMVQDKFKK